MMKYPTLPFARIFGLAGTLCLSASLIAQDPTKSELENAPAVGSQARDFQLQAVAGELSGEVALSEVNKDSPVVLIVLRGFPGYQCPVCTRQVAALFAKAEEFVAKGAKVLLVYPGPAGDLESRAEEFLKGTEIPEPFTLLIDPGYTFTEAYGLRWDAPRETAYPSTFAIGADGTIQFAKISQTHGGRSSPDEVLDAL